MSNRKQVADQKLQVMRAYRGLFLMDDGQIKPEAQAVLRDLEKENTRLKKLVADLSLDNDILKEAASGNF